MPRKVNNTCKEGKYTTGFPYLFTGRMTARGRKDKNFLVGAKEGEQKVEGTNNTTQKHKIKLKKCIDPLCIGIV